MDVGILAAPDVGRDVLTREFKMPKLWSLDSLRLQKGD